MINFNHRIAIFKYFHYYLQTTSASVLPAEGAAQRGWGGGPGGPGGPDCDGSGRPRPFNGTLTTASG